MGMSYQPVVCNRCNADIKGAYYPNENWCRDCEPMQMKILRDKVARLERELRTARERGETARMFIAQQRNQANKWMNSNEETP